MTDLPALITEALKAPGVLKEVYGDLAKPGVSQVGKALGSVLGLGNTILWPITLMNEKAKYALENNLERFRKKMEAIPSDEVIPIPPEIGVPVAEKLAYVTDVSLSEMYLNLLAKAASYKEAGLAHPSFANLIGNLSPDEAALLPYLQNDLPFLEARLTNKTTNHWKTLNPVITGLDTTVRLVYPSNIVAYLSNLEGLGLIDIRYDRFMVLPEDPYLPLEARYRPVLEGIKFNTETDHITFERGKIESTPFGRQFIAACINSPRVP
jgi:hypothetical protein